MAALNTCLFIAVGFYLLMGGGGVFGGLQKKSHNPPQIEARSSLNLRLVITMLGGRWMAVGEPQSSPD